MVELVEPSREDLGKALRLLGYFGEAARDVGALGQVAAVVEAHVRRHLGHHEVIAREYHQLLVELTGQGCSCGGHS